MAETSGEQGRVLIVDSVSTRRRALHCHLLAASFNAADAENAEEAVARCSVSEFDLILLTAESARIAVESCRLLRTAVPDCGLVILTDFHDPNQTADVFEAGADQCLARDLYVPELLAYVRAILRRTRVHASPADSPITIGEISLDPARRMVFRAGVPIQLSFKEYELLHYLMIHAGTPVDHASLLKAIWGEDDITRIDCLRLCVLQLRRRLKDQIRPKYLLTENWIGYRFVDASEAPSAARRGGQAAAA